MVRQGIEGGKKRIVMEKDSVLRVENLSVSFGDQAVLHGVSFAIPKKTITAILGPNGAGKTVLFRALLGIVKHQGTVEWQKDIRVGYVPQKFAIDPSFPLTVGEFFALKDAQGEKITDALRAVGMHGDEHHVQHHILERRMGELSGGEFQKVSIAWALIDNPDVLLFDEPTAGVDVGSEETIYSLIGHIRDERGLTILVISHELNIVYQYADQVVCLNKRMICQGPPKHVLDAGVLKEMYGVQIGVYEHKDNTDHHSLDYGNDVE